MKLHGKPFNFQKSYLMAFTYLSLLCYEIFGENVWWTQTDDKDVSNTLNRFNHDLKVSLIETGLKLVGSENL